MNNSAISGGGIMYDLYRPTISNLTFIHNSATYGPDIASYAVRLKIIDQTEYDVLLDSVVSGQNTTKTLIYELRDYDDQTMNLNNESIITIRSTRSINEASNNLVKVTNGRAVFDSLIFVAEPGSSNRSFTVNSNAINLFSARAQLGSNYALPKITVNYRFCKPGEFQSNNICFN